MADALFPTAARRTTIPADGGPLAALTSEPGSPGSTGGQSGPTPTILLVPGYTGSKEDFAPILDVLAGQGFRAVAIDQPGQYESPGPDDEQAYTPQRLGTVLSGVIGHLAAAGGPVVLLGHSYGGLVSRAAMLAGARVAGLVLLCSGPDRFHEGNRFDALTFGEPILRENGQQALFDRRRVAAGLDPIHLEPAAEFERRRFVASSYAGLLGMGRALLTEPDLVDELAATLRRSGTPVAVIAGESDDAWPLDAQNDMARRLGTELMLIPDAAHSPAVENPSGLLDVLLPLFRTWTAG